MHEKLIAEHQRRGGAVPQGAGAGGEADDAEADERARELGDGRPLMHSPAAVMKRAPTGSTAVHPTRSAECTFAPRTKGVAPGMAAAAHYTSANVFDRLTREVEPAPSSSPPAGGDGVGSLAGGDEVDPLGRNVMDVSQFMSVLQLSLIHI